MFPGVRGGRCGWTKGIKAAVEREAERNQADALEWGQPMRVENHSDVTGISMGHSPGKAPSKLGTVAARPG